MLASHVEKHYNRRQCNATDYNNAKYSAIIATTGKLILYYTRDFYYQLIFLTENGLVTINIE